ncbi:MAG: DNA-3-methyladenine glycosylase 2 family protein [Quinella sp. 1Q5]|nr:DNA-3-methyladenine glycosylase 2 family protein [Quinella sp. 1Q5]
MEIRINDDFDLKKIVDSGQCFRPKEISSGVFRFIVGENILHISGGEGVFNVDCSAENWERVWENYFDLETNYASIRHDVEVFAAGKPYEPTLIDAANFGKGIRILRQDPFETLISFIISQRKSIPSIRTSIERICERFGRRVGEVYLFPRLEDFTDDLTGLGLAYRKDYIRDALDKVASGMIDLVELETFSDVDLVEELKLINGIGDKVANCVALFAYHRVNRAPVDVWIKRAIDEDFGGENIFSAFGKNAGILQQYVFYHKRSNR